MSTQEKETEEILWVTVASFYRPATPEAGFEDVLASEKDRWLEVSRQAGLAPEDHVRVCQGEEEVTIEISPALDAVFTPVQTLWKAQ